MELKQVIISQSTEILEITNKLKQFTKSKLRSSDLFESNELYVSFQQLMKEKDTMIAELLEKSKSAQAA